MDLAYSLSMVIVVSLRKLAMIFVRYGLKDLLSFLSISRCLLTTSNAFLKSKKIRKTLALCFTSLILFLSTSACDLASLIRLRGSLMLWSVEFYCLNPLWVSWIKFFSVISFCSRLRMTFSKTFDDIGRNAIKLMCPTSGMERSRLRVERRSHI